MGGGGVSTLIYHDVNELFMWQLIDLFAKLIHTLTQWVVRKHKYTSTCTCNMYGVPKSNSLVEYIRICRMHAFLDF